MLCVTQTPRFSVAFESNTLFFGGVWFKHHSFRSVNNKQTIWLSNITSQQDDVCTKNGQRDVQLLQSEVLQIDCLKHVLDKSMRPKGQAMW